ncbi:hypothetical protein KXD40_008429 [Peronospora effusa]|uniref:RxLR effector PexRD54 WY domain-containing protein n=1 Tax=Peronospora effusa TaxID=542832 RepID=A0A3M6VW21_9STRA|nr:hypothetical protein DD238_002408 [Peronospora effusa]UIZ24541.1 hypothetical protein KXD40_008429 [Peronospora effusa]
MSTKSSEGQVFYVKMLVFFCALLAYSGSSVVAAQSSSVIHNAHGLDKLTAASSSVSSIKRHLRSSADTESGGCFILRRLGISLNENVSKVVSDFQESWGRLWQKSSDGTFKDLKLHKTKGGPFENSKFLDWVTYVESLYHKSLADAYKAMFSTLARRYKDAADLTRILVEGKNIESTRSIATKLLGVQVQRWIKKGKSSEQVFRLLNLDKKEGGPFESQILMQWFDFVYLDYKAYPSTPRKAINVMMSTLERRDKPDAILARFLMAKKEIERTEDIASEMLNAQARRWIDDERFEAHVFTSLELDKTGDKLFENPLFTQWVNFVNLRFSHLDEANKAKEANVAMFTTLKLFYTDEVLTKILDGGMKIPATRDIASKLKAIIQPSKEDNWVKMPASHRFGALSPDRHQTIDPKNVVVVPYPEK